MPAFGLDVELARAGDDRLKVPSTTFKGVLLGAAAEIAKAMPELQLDGQPFGQRVVGLFGQPGEIGDDFEERRKKRGLLSFSDLHSDSTFPRDKGGRFVRVKIDPDTATALPGQLMFVEAVAERGAKLTFNGTVGFDGKDKSAATTARGVLDRAASLLHSIGSMKSSGFGRIASVTFGEPKPVKPVKSDVKPVDTIVTLTIDRPFIVGTIRHGMNLVEGDVEVPGSVLKAVIANAMLRGGVDPAPLAGLTIRHAREVIDGKSVLPAAPLSLYSYDKDGKILVADALGAQAALPPNSRFASDWKPADETAIAEFLAARGYGLTNRQASATAKQTRTAIDPEKYTSNYDSETGGQLFAQVAVDPAGRLWDAQFDFSTADPAFIERVMAMLTAGCGGLGKTAAVVSAQSNRAAEAASLAGARAIVLLSDAVVLPQNADGATTDLAATYESYFKALGLEMEDYFASHRLSGGYLAKVYPAQIGKLRPWLLTRAGSVFLFRAGSEKPMLDLLKRGLPPNHPNNDDWKIFPFQRENGWGEVMPWLAGRH